MAHSRSRLAGHFLVPKIQRRKWVIPIFPIEKHLWIDTKIGGVMRFEHDSYMRSDDSPSNAWFICTLWLADFRIAIARKKEDLKGALEILEWTIDEETFPVSVFFL